MVKQARINSEGMRKLFIILLTAILCSGCFRNRENDDMELWYDHPAAVWNEALPAGNGRLGVMVFGNPLNESIQINEESLWAGSKINNNNPKALKNLPALREAIFKGEFEKAEKIGSDFFVGTPPRIRSYQPVGNLKIRYLLEDTISDYRRSLTLNTGMIKTEFGSGGGNYIQKVYVSAPDNIIVVEIKSYGDAVINAVFNLERDRDAVIQVSDEGRIVMKGQIMDEDDPLKGPGGAHMRFAAEARFNVVKGILSATGDSLRVEGASDIRCYITAATDYNIEMLDMDAKRDPSVICRDILDKLSDDNIRSVEKRHIEEHRKIFDRVALSLGEDSLKILPVDKRLERVKNGQEDNGLAALYFAYGRYLLMGSSRPPAVLPANLQGIWNKDYNAPWNSDFHTNINLQMNYWPAEVCNLPETAEVLANFISRLTVPGAVTAREMYGTEGWTMHHLTDPFGRTGVADGLWGLTPTNGPWMTFPLFEHYLFTLDTVYLRKVAYPVLKGSVQFLLGFLVESPEGYLVTNPSTSPENRYTDPATGKTAWLTYSATIDVQTVNAVFDFFRQAAGILHSDIDLVRQVSEAQQKLPPVRISSNGTIQEWIHNYEEAEPGHRHMSHLLGLYPLAQITPDTPELFEAAGKTIERRLSFGGGHTGWSRAWIINFYARLKDGNKAYNHLMLLFKRSTLKNLFDTHPPFQIDGNFGATAGIAEMLLQSHGGMIELLPALPKAWESGRVKGLVARGGFIVGFSWEKGSLKNVSVLSTKGGLCRIKYGQKILEKETLPGKTYNFKELYSDR